MAHTTKKNLKPSELPEGVIKALQGVTYWIGHRRFFYREHLLQKVP